MEYLYRFIIVVALSFPTNVLAEECEGLDSIAVLTANELFDAAKVCTDIEGAVGMMIIGQIRAMSDLAAFKPATLSDQEKATNLYRRIYGNLGGAGPDGAYRDDLTYAALRELIESWYPSTLSNYSPGWNASSMPSELEYSHLISQQKNSRLEQLDQHHLLIIKR